MTEIQTTDKITVRLIEKMGGDHMIAAAAKVSTDGEAALQWADPEKAEEVGGLINYLMKMNHGSPFEHSAMTFFVHAPIFVWREWHRHRAGFCVTGDTKVDFVNINGTKYTDKTIEELYLHWEHGEISGQRSAKESLDLAIEMVMAGASVRAANERTGVARGTIERHVSGKVAYGRRGARWRIGKMRLRVMDESSGLFTHSHIIDVIKSGVKPVVRLTTSSGRTLTLTACHDVWTKIGWRKAGDLRSGDSIGRVGKINTSPGIPPSLRRGIGVWTSMQRNSIIGDRGECYVCKSFLPKDELNLDHVVPVVEDLTMALNINNLKPICTKCHRQKTNSEQIKSSRALKAGVVFDYLSCDPEPCGERMTYDLSAEGHHNFVANGIVVHNSYNETSARYSVLEPLFYMATDKRPVLKVDDWKAGRPKFLKAETEAEKDALAFFNTDARASYQRAYDVYEKGIASGLDPGYARTVLPVGIYSSCWVTCNPRSLMAFLSLRTHDPEATFVSYPLYEIEVAARVAELFLAEGWPLTYKAFCANGRVGP